MLIFEQRLYHPELDNVNNVNASTRKSFFTNMGKRTVLKKELDRDLILPVVELPVIVKMTRIASRLLDDDNLTARCKFLRDHIAEQLGIDDADDRVMFIVQQQVVPNSKYYKVQLFTPTKEYVNLLIESYKITLYRKFIKE